MNPAPHNLLGEGTLYNRLCLATEVLGRFVSCAPKALDLGQLTAATRGTPRELGRLCRLLCDDGLLVREPGKRSAWRLARDPSTVTLEDAFRCMLAQQPARAKAQAASEEECAADGVESEVDVLVMQATMTVNQSVLQLLRRFSLDRLRVAMLKQAAAPEAAWRFGRLGFS
jgi:DNA-binding IscR family transcriptional regulator